MLLHKQRCSWRKATECAPICCQAENRFTGTKCNLTSLHKQWMKVARPNLQEDHGIQKMQHATEKHRSTEDIINVETHMAIIADNAFNH